MVEGRKTKRSANAARSVLAAALLACSLAAGAVTLEGVRYDDSIRVGSSRAVLNGVGVRAVAVFKGYVAGLYLPKKETDAGAIFAQHGAKRIAVRMLVDVNAATLAKTFSDGIRKNYKDDELDALRERMQAFDDAVRGTGGVKKGDAIDLDYDPASGTRLRINGKAQAAAIAGDDFYVALLKMFIGERAIDKNLRAALLGQGT
jgi:Chalcone isomerase-like